jgi:hypothetical protein
MAALSKCLILVTGTVSVFMMGYGIAQLNDPVNGNQIVNGMVWLIVAVTIVVTCFSLLIYEVIRQFRYYRMPPSLRVYEDEPSFISAGLLVAIFLSMTFFTTYLYLTTT